MLLQQNQNGKRLDKRRRVRPRHRRAVLELRKVRVVILNFNQSVTQQLYSAHASRGQRASRGLPRRSSLDVVACQPGVAYGVAPRRGPSIWIVHRGRAVVSSATNKDRPPIDVAPGAVLFVDAGEELSLVVDADADERLLAYASTTNIA